MRLAALFSGGKDSTFAIFAARQEGHSVECLVTIHPESDQSHILHFPGTELTRLQAESMQIPLLASSAGGTSAEDELGLIYEMLSKAKQRYGIDGVVHGGILSEFQRDSFASVCARLDLEVVAPIWGADQTQYMRRLLKDGFDFILTSVTADGLDGRWLGRPITGEDLRRLEEIARRHSFNISFEGGEAETLVVDCPLFSRPVAIRKAKKIWDGYRGRFEIQEAELDNHA